MTTSPRSVASRSTADTWTAVADQGLYSATSFVTTLLLARHVSVGDLGWFSAGISLLITTVGFMSSFVAIPLTLAIQGATPRDRSDQLAGGLGASVALAGVVAVGLLGAALFGFAWIGRSAALPGWLLVLAVVVVPMVVREYARQMAFAQPGLPGLAVMDLTYSVVALGGLGLLARAGRLDAIWGLAVVGGAALASVLAWSVTARATIRWHAVASAPRFLQRHLRMSRWLCGASILYACSISAVPWFLGLLAASASVGLFAAYATIAGVLNPLLAVASNLTAPRAARAVTAESYHPVRRTALIASATAGIGLGVVAVGLGFAETTLVPLLFGPAFEAAPYLLWLLLASAVCEGLGIGAFWGLHALGESRTAFWARAAAVVLSLPVGAWAILRLGVLGAAWLMLALRALNAGFNWVSFLVASRSPGPVGMALPTVVPSRPDTPMVGFGPDGAR
ncbi:MAG: lipopolysaccharide biosynthesis protein [Gemmatimonadales bacterium]